MGLPLSAIPTRVFAGVTGAPLGFTDEWHIHYLERIRMKNHWLDEKKKYVKIYDNTQNTLKTPLTSGRFEAKDAEEKYAGRVPKDDIWTLRAEIDDQFWFDRLDRQLFYWSRPVQEEPEYPAHWSLPTQPGQ